nr:MAG TPA: Large subunit terminase [Caudoviricetes sp.]
MAEIKTTKKQVSFKLHEKQAEVFYNDCRFRVVVAGRRFGKTKLSMLTMLAWATKKLQKIWYVAPTYRMAKQIMWNDLKANVPLEWVTKIRENELSMEFRNGSVISLRGADKPDSLRGVSLDFLVLDEFQDIAGETWTTVLRPTLADRRGYALFIGCVTGDTKIMTDSGVRPIESFSKGEAAKTLTPIDTNLYGIDRAYHKADNFWNNGVVKTRKYGTHMGFKMESSLPHPIWTIDENGVEGWKKTEDLKIGDRVAIARGMEQWANKSIMTGWEDHYQDWYDKLPRKIKIKPTFKETPDLAYFLGLWLAEGSVEEKIGRLSITCGDDVSESLDERVFGVPFKKCTGRDDQWRINSYAVMEFMRYIKMPLCKAPGKRLPEWIWSCSRETAAQVLSGMWDGDGSIGIPGKKNHAYYATSSEAMARDVQLLLTNFGIVSRITRKITKPTERAKVYSQEYSVTVQGANVSKLAEVLKLRLERKRVRLEQMKGLISKRDGAPIYQLLKELKKNFAEVKLGKLETALGAAKTTGSDTTFPTLNAILEETKSVSNTEAYKALKRIADNHYYWDTITYIEESEAQTYDFTVPDTHSFWSNGFISHNTPKGYNHLYKLYKMGQIKAKQMKKEWMSWQFPTITSPFIPRSEIEAARRDMDEKSFRQEFLGSFESMSGRVYYAFDRKNNVADVEFNPRLPIWVGMDFNIDPMSTVIFQPQANGQLWAVDEIVQVSSNTDDICTELEKRYYKYQDRVIIYPDPAGSARQHARGESDLDIMREHGFKRIKVKRAHSAVADRVNAVNRMLRSASGESRLFINPKCKHLIESFEQTLYIAGSRDVDKSLGVEHSADAAGYCIELEFPLRKFTPIGFSR